MSGQTGNEYPDQDALVAAEGYGWTVAVVLHRKRANSSRTYPVVVGVFDTQQEARSKAATMRNRAKKWAEYDPSLSVLSVNVEPIWEDLK